VSQQAMTELLRLADEDDTLIAQDDLPFGRGVLSVHCNSSQRPQCPAMSLDLERQLLSNKFGAT
jgi:hypothetical protein